MICIYVKCKYQYLKNYKKIKITYIKFLFIELMSKIYWKHYYYINIHILFKNKIHGACVLLCHRVL
jgi:hypothetical protein